MKNRIKNLLQTRELTRESFHLKLKCEFIVNNIDEMVFLYRVNYLKDTLHEFTEINDICVKNTGYKKENLLNMKLTDLVIKEHKLILNSYFTELESTDTAVIEVKIMKKDGTSIPVEINSKTLNLNCEKMVLSVVKNI